MDRATASFLSAPAYGSVVQPTMQPTTMFGQPGSAWDASYYQSPSLPSLPGGQPAVVDPGQWTAQAFGAQQQQQQAQTPKSVATTSVYDPYMGYSPSAIQDAFDLLDKVGTLDLSAYQTQPTVRSGATTALDEGPAYASSGRNVSVGSGPASASGGPAYGDRVQMADGSLGNYAAPGLAMDQNGNLVGWGGGSIFDSWGGGNNSSSAGGGCYLTTAAIEGQEADDGPTLTALRWFRDAVMGGKSEVPEYYATAPRIVAWIDAHPKRDRIYAAIRRCVLAPCVAMICRGEFEKTYRLYKRMVRFLEARANG